MNNLFKRNKTKLIFSLFLIFILLSLLNSYYSIQNRIADSLLFGISIFSFIVAMKILIDKNPIERRFLNYIMGCPMFNGIIIGPIAAMIFYLFYPEFIGENFGDGINDSMALLVFALVIAGYLDEEKKETSKKKTSVLSIIVTRMNSIINLISMLTKLIRYIILIIYSVIKNLLRKR